MKNYVQPGDVITVIAPYNVSAGDGVHLLTLFGVAVSDAAQGSPVPIKTTGVFDLPKEATDTFGVGNDVYWHPDLRRCVDAPGIPIGHSLAEAGDGTTTIRVRLGTPPYIAP